MNFPNNLKTICNVLYQCQEMTRYNLKPGDIFQMKGTWYKVSKEVQRQSPHGVGDYGSTWWVTECNKLNEKFEIDTSHPTLDVLTNYPELGGDPFIVCRPVAHKD